MKNQRSPKNKNAMVMNVMTGLVLVFLTSTTLASEFQSNSVNLTLGANRTNIKTQGNTVGDGESTDLATDIKFGYLFTEFYLGGIYSTWDRTYVVGTSSSVGDRRTSYGISLGYHDSGFVFDFNYFLASTWNNNNSAIIFGSGSGYGVDIGYNMSLSSTFYIGFVYTMKFFTYQKATLAGGTELTEANKRNDSYPMIQLGVQF